MTTRSLWPSTQQSLLLRLRSFEDVTAWQQFVDVYGPLIYRFTRLRGLQDADANDVTQEVFKQVAKAIGTFEYDKERGRFRSWLGTIARNEIGRYMKRAAKQGRGIGGSGFSQITDSQPANFEDHWIGEFNSHVYQTALSRIQKHFDQETWEAFDLVWTQDWESKDVARKMNRAVGWVYKAKFKVLQRFKEEVENIASDVVSLE